jgi:pimeloyl-ACP methyl ester carboxylesterase
VERAILLDPALHVDPQVATERAALLRDDVSFASPDEAIDTRLGDGSLFTTPRAFLEEEAEQHLERGDEGRYRWRYSPTAVIVAWSEMATEQPPWPRCPTLVVVGVQSWIPVRVPRLANLQSLPVPGGHSVLWDDFDATAAAVEEFLAR